MNTHRFILEKYKGASSRYTCPQCDTPKSFTRYVDTTTGGYIREDVGRCNRENNCTYHFTPKQYYEQNPNSFEKNSVSVSTSYRRGKQETSQKVISAIPPKILWQSMQHGKNIVQLAQTNHFTKYLIRLFGGRTAFCLMYDYFVGTSKNGGTVFWQIDVNEKVRTGKIMLYNPETGKRSKEVLPNWVHSKLQLPNFNLRQCFFGEHMLPLFKNKTVAIVESEKTAIIASQYLPQFVWIACGGLAGLQPEKFEVLKGRDVVLFPDIKGFDKWRQRADELSHIANIKVSELLEKKANSYERENGLDLADYLIRYNPKEFSKQ